MDFDFDVSTVKPLEDRTPVPAGEYRAAITRSEQKQTKAGNGSYLELTIEILDGEHKGRLIWERLNLKNPNEQAVAIAQRTLASICQATGVQKAKSSEELHNKPMIIKVAVVTSGEYAGNEIKGFKASNAVAVASGGTEKPAWA